MVADNTKMYKSVTGNEYFLQFWEIGRTYSSASCQNPIGLNEGPEVARLQGAWLSTGGGYSGRADITEQRFSPVGVCVRAGAEEV